MPENNWPTEADATAAVEAAARAVYEGSTPEDSLPWEQVPAMPKLAVREAVLPIVWAALSALPDPRFTAWMEGFIVADNGGDIEANPYAGS